MEAFKDHYKALQVAPNATLAQVKDQYRKLAVHHHPDRGGDAGAMSSINDAYTTLSDPERRLSYDESYRDFQIPRPRTAPPPAPYTAQPEAPKPAQRPRARPAQNAWKSRFWILAGLVAAVLIYQAGRGAVRPSAQPSSSAAKTQGGLTAQQQVASDAVDRLKQQYDACMNSLTQQQNGIESSNEVLRTDQLQGNTDLYNSTLAAHNAAVDQFNATQANCTQLRNQYNSEAAAFNRSLQ